MKNENFLAGDDEKINSLLRFTAEVDKMTAVYRRTLLLDKSRRENDAEHSWHIALMAMIFKDYAPDGCDVARSVQMCIVHDLVEIYAGDTFAFDVQANVGKSEREAESADKLFSQLPPDIAKEIRTLWEEFDAMETPDAKYAAAMDRLQPYLHNTLTDGHTWKEGNPSQKMVDKRMQVVLDTIPALKNWYDKNCERAHEKGWLNG